jgi:uncharacterized protein YecE (DUF72 family)
MARVWIGTSGFGYKEWKVRFYPPDLPDRQMLPYYATRLKSVEIDSTFYRMPTKPLLEGWLSATPDDFRFTIKAPQQITHRQRLKTPSDALSHLLSTLSVMGPRLGAVCFQLPPFSKCDHARLEAFLQAAGTGVPCAFEFRHASWLAPETYGLLRRHRAALCIHDTDDGCTPLEITVPWVYVRLRRTVYSPEQREEWRSRFRAWADSGIEVFAYVKHKDNPDAPNIALDFARGF